MPGNIFKPLIVLLALLLGIYAFGTGGIFFIDDAPAMDGMLAVSDWGSAAYYVFGGTAGPLGRPVSLASFLLQKGAYPESAAPFLWVNIFIHLANVGLLWWLVRRLQRQLPALLKGGGEWLAPVVAILWGVLPILASASLMVVQRMTTLSALFMLLGVHAYLWAREQAQRPHWAGLALGIVGIGLCTVLAALSKENGVLLPLLLLVMHHVLFGAARSADAVAGVPASNWLRHALTLSLWLPSLLLLGYMTSQIPTLEGRYAYRPFSLHDRLASEVVILWEYLWVAFVPRLADLSPFRDDYPIRQFSDGVVQLALAAWVALLATSAVLWRKGRPMLLFAVLWYLVGHLLESGMFPLFLYFEHRNYVPLIGPVLALAVWFAGLVAVPANVRVLAAGAYGVFLAFMLWQATSMWGNRQQLVWAQAHPDSPRALQMLAGAYMQAGKVNEVEAMYERAFQHKPRRTSVAMQGLRASCYLNDGGEAAHRWLAHVRRSLPTGEHSHLTVGSLGAIARLQMQGRCAGVEPADILALADLAEGNPVFRRRQDRQSLNVVRANVLLSQGDATGAMAQMRQALKELPDMDTIQALHQLTLATQGKEAAAAFLQEARAIRPPGGRFASQQWQRQLDVLGAP